MCVQFTSKLLNQSRGRAPCQEFVHRCTDNQQNCQKHSLSRNCFSIKNKNIETPTYNAGSGGKNIDKSETEHYPTALFLYYYCLLTVVAVELHLTSFTFCPVLTFERIFSPFNVQPGPSTMLELRVLRWTAPPETVSDNFSTRHKDSCWITTRMRSTVWRRCPDAIS